METIPSPARDTAIGLAVVESHPLTDDDHQDNHRHHQSAGGFRPQLDAYCCPVVNGPQKPLPASGEITQCRHRYSNAGRKSEVTTLPEATTAMSRRRGV